MLKLDLALLVSGLHDRVNRSKTVTSCRDCISSSFLEQLLTHSNSCGSCGSLLPVIEKQPSIMTIRPIVLFGTLACKFRCRLCLCTTQRCDLTCAFFVLNILISRCLMTNNIRNLHETTLYAVSHVSILLARLLPSACKFSMHHISECATLIWPQLRE